MIPEIDCELLGSLLRDLVAIDSVNPTLVPGANGEKDAAQFLCAFLQERGIPAELQDAAPGRPSVVAWLGPPPPITEGKPRAALAILAHIDTVGPGDMPDPFTPIEKGGRLYGRGALDIKSGVAAMCSAALAVARSGSALRKSILLAAVVDEECNSLGTTALLERITADCAVVLEPTNLQIVIAHKGYAWLEVTTHGRAAHGSMPSEGRDAIRMMARLLGKLDAIETALRAQNPHPLLGHASLHASLISGGQELSSYPAECRLQYERRLLPGETPETARAEIEKALAELRTAGAGFTAAARPLGARPAYEIAPEAPIARAAASAVRAVLGNVHHAGMAPWTDTALLAAAGIPGVVFGPSGCGLHGREEYVELATVESCARILAALITSICGS